MAGKIALPLVLLLIALLVPACVDLKEPYQKIEYYTLEYPPPAFTGLSSLPVTLRVARFTASPEYDSERIIYRDEAFTRNAYAYHRWRARPSKLVRDYLARDLRRSGLFQAVFAEQDAAADYVIEGSVEEFLEWDQKEQWQAVLTLDITLLAPQETNISRQIVFQKTFSARRPAERKTPQAIADAMSRAMASVSAEIIRTVYDAIASASP